MQEQESLFEEKHSFIDWKKEWKNMPEFECEGGAPFKQIFVNFECFDDMKEFSRLINQAITIDTKSVWYPKYSKEAPKNFVYVSEKIKKSDYINKEKI